MWCCYCRHSAAAGGGGGGTIYIFWPEKHGFSNIWDDQCNVMQQYAPRIAKKPKHTSQTVILRICAFIALQQLSIALDMAKYIYCLTYTYIQFWSKSGYAMYNCHLLLHKCINVTSTLHMEWMGAAVAGAAPRAAPVAAYICAFLASIYVWTMWVELCIRLWSKFALGTSNHASSAFVAS